MVEGTVKANGGGRKSVRQQFQIERVRRRGGGRLPRYTKRRPGLHRRLFGNCTKGLAVVSLTCWNGTTCQRNMVCHFSCKMRSGRVGPKCRIISRLYFFNGVPFSFEARLTGTVCRENINYSTTTPPPVLVV